MICLMLMYPDPPIATKPAILADEAELTANNSKSKDNTTIFVSMSSFVLRVPFFLPTSRNPWLGHNPRRGRGRGAGGGGLPHRDVEARPKNSILKTHPILDVI